MEREPALLLLVRQLVMLLPLLALPFTPALGTMGADLVLSIVLQHDALQ